MRARLATRGFTLVELMITIAIVAILASLGTYGVGKYIRSARSSEATTMIASIKAAQEAYRGETFNYKAVNGADVAATTTFYPRAVPDSKVHGWGDTSTAAGVAWRELGVRPDGPVRYSYGCAAGLAGSTVSGNGMTTAITNWPTTSNAPWYVVRARGNLDDDTTYSNFVSASFAGQIFTERDDE